MEHINYVLAHLELQGGHYAEAVKMYQDLLREEPFSSKAWCGLAIAKYGLVLEQKASVHEVFRLFGKAKEVAPEEAAWIEYLMLQSSLKVVEEIYKLFHHYHQQLSRIAGGKGWAFFGWGRRRPDRGKQMGRGKGIPQPAGSGPHRL